MYTEINSDEREHQVEYVPFKKNIIKKYHFFFRGKHKEYLPVRHLNVVGSSDTAAQIWICLSLASFLCFVLTSPQCYVIKPYERSQFIWFSWDQSCYAGWFSLVTLWRGTLPCSTWHYMNQNCWHKVAFKHLVNPLALCHKCLHAHTRLCVHLLLFKHLFLPLLCLHVFDFPLCD